MMKILLAEDEAMTLAALQKNLEDEGYQVVATSNGQEALQAFHDGPPDLVITDILMPYTSGLELLSAIRSDGSKDTPVIVLSSMEQESTMIEAFNLGADDFITKPFKGEELRLRVKRLLKRSRNGNSEE